MVVEGFNKFQTKRLNKHKNPLIGDILSIRNSLRLEINYAKVNVIDVNLKDIS